MDEDIREVVEEARIVLRLTVCVARYDSGGAAYHEEFLARYGVSRDER